MVVGDISTGTEVLVIGGGPGGYVAAIRAAQLDLDVTLVEADAVGGACLNRGCIPSKAMISATDIAHEANSSQHLGVHGDFTVDTEQMVSWKDDIVEQLTSGVEQLCQANGVDFVEGRAEFTNENSVRVVHQGDGQGSESIDFEYCIIATGSTPIEIPGFEFDGERILSSRDVLSLSSPPESIVVVGGGYIGMELSTVLAKLGTDVTVVEMLDDILPNYEEDVSRPVRKRAEDLGIQFHFGQRVSEWHSEDEQLVVTADDESGSTSEYIAKKCLVAIGRRPVTETLNLEATGLQPNDQGFIETDDRARTNSNHIFAVGDVAGEPMLAHKASQEGEVAAEVIAQEPAALDYQSIPAVVFTDPEVGTVGLTKSEAEEAGFEPVVGQMPLQASGRALTMSDTTGFVRIVADHSSGYILGAQIVAPEASELIAEVGFAIEMGAKLGDLSSTIHTHPTLSEAIMEAAANAQNKAIHTLNQ